MPIGLQDLSEDAIRLIGRELTASARPARTILRTLSALSKSCRITHIALHDRLSELRGLPVDVWAATAGAVPAQLMWEITNYRGLDLDYRERVFSPKFRHGQWQWRLLIFPNGDEVERHRPGAPPHLSAFVDVADAAMLPYGWVREAHFLLTVVHRRKPNKTIVRYARHDFEATARDYGFRELLPIEEIEKAEDKGGFLHEGTLTLQVKVWPVPDAMRQAEREQQQLQSQQSRPPHRWFGGTGASSAAHASTASSTSMGSDSTGSIFRRRGGTARAIAALTRRFSSLFRSTRRTNYRREPYYGDLRAGGAPPDYERPATA